MRRHSFEGSYYANDNIKAKKVESLTDRQWALKEKVGPRKSITLVAASGLVPNTHSALVQKVLTLDDLFRDVLN